MPLLGRGIAAALGAEGSFHAAATATDLASARTLLGDEGYDLVVCDEAAAVTDASLTQLQEQLAGSAYQPPLIVLVHGQLSTGVRQLAANAARSGVAFGVVDVSAQVDELRRAIVAIQAGRSFIDPSLAGELLQSPAHSLTPREQAVFDHMITGATNKAIAAAMHVSPETVKTHVKNILRKLDAPTRMAAVLQAQRANLVSHTLNEEPEIIHSAGVAVFSAGLDGAILSCNPAAADLYGCDRTAVIGEPLGFILPDSTDAELTTLRDELTSGAHPAAHLETRLTSSAGEQLDLYVTISPIRDRRADEVVGFSAISRPSPVQKHIGDLLDDARLAQLRTTGLLDSPSEERYDRFTQLAARVLQAPVALLTLIDDQRQYAKSSTEHSGPLAAGGDRPLLDSICAHVVAEGSAIAISNTRLDPRVSEMPAVIEGNVAAYASSPITTRTGHTLGALCVLDYQPRHWKSEDKDTLHDLAAIAADEIDQLLENIAFREIAADARELVADTRDGVADTRDGVADRRDGAADSRDDVADARDSTADSRDVATDIRIAEVERESGLAAYSCDEYQRALYHYQQIVRHRIANPLQVIKGMADMLLNQRDPQLELPKRQEILNLIIEQAGLMERLSLFAPEVEDDVERELRPKPFA